LRSVREFGCPKVRGLGDILTAKFQKMACFLLPWSVKVKSRFIDK
jgi:hypothetical protein